MTDVTVYKNLYNPFKIADAHLIFGATLEIGVL